MQIRRRINLLWGVVLLAIALLVMAQSLGVIPPAMFDLIFRAWPALLVMAGLAFLLRGRVPFGSLIALVVSLVLAGGVMNYAFSTRAGEYREDNIQEISQPLRDNLSLLRLRVDVQSTDSELLTSNQTAVTGTFVGSTESNIVVEYVESESDGSATLTIRETRPSAFPMLEAVGRGRMRLELPPNIPLDVEFLGASGNVTVNMSGTRLERLNLNVAAGDALVTLPEYDPIFSEDDDNLGTLAVRDGDITVFVPRNVSGRFELDRGGSSAEPVYDPSVYNFLFNRLLEARLIETAEFVVQYNIIAPRGRIRLEVPGE